MRKRINKILWYGDEILDEKAKAPGAATSADGLDGLNEGEIYISNNEKDPALFIRTSSGKVVRIGSDNLFKLVQDEQGNYYIHTPYSFASDKTVSSLGVGNDGEGEASALSALYKLVDVLRDGENDKVSGAEDGNVLMYDAATGKWYGKKVNLPDVDFSDINDKFVSIDGLIKSLQEKDIAHDESITAHGKAIAALQGEHNALAGTVNDFLTGVDVDDTINRWKELEKFLTGYTETATLADLLGVKADKSVVDALTVTVNSNYTTLDGLITAEKNRAVAAEGALSARIETNRGNIAKNTKDIADIFNTLTDWFTLEDGVLHSKYGLASDKTVSSLGVGTDGTGGVSYDRLDSWDSYTDDKAGYVLSAALGWDLKTRLDNLDIGDFDLSGYQPLISATNKLSYSLLDGAPTSLKNPYALKFGSKSYDGSEEKTVTAADLGALTEHQTIYALTIKDSAGKAQLTYTPNVKAGEITLTKAMVGLGLVENTALSTWKGTTNITTLGTVTSGTWKGTKIANDYIANPHVTIAGNKVNLGGSLSAATLQTSFDMVTLSTEQTITGKKTFTKQAVFSNGIQIGNDGAFLWWDGEALRVNKPFASDSTVSSLGVGEDGGEGVHFDILQSWDNYTDGEVMALGANLGYELKQAIENINIGAYLTKSEAENTYATIRSLNSVISRVGNIENTYVTSSDLGDFAYKNSLTASDIPNIPWGKITSGKPTSLSGYGITDAYTKEEVNNAIGEVDKRIDTLVGSSASKAIDTFNEVVAFLKDIEDTETLEGILAGKQDAITDLAAIRDGAALGATALQSSDLDGYVNEITTSGSGNAITSVTKSGKKLTFNKASSFFLAGNFTKANIKTTLGISDWALASSKPSYKTSEVAEDGNLYFTTERVKNYLTGAVSSVLTSNLTASRALISNASGKISVSAVTSTELGYLDGVTSAIQTQLNALSRRIKAYEDILKIEENNTLLHATVAFASDSTVSSLGVGEDGEISGGVIDLTNVVSHIIPSLSNAYTIGDANTLWKAVYATELYAGNVAVGSTIASLQSTLGTATSNIQGLTSALSSVISRVGNIENTYVTSSDLGDFAYKNSLAWSELTDKPTVMIAHGWSDADWNTVKTNGTYYVGSTSTNKPDSYGQMIVSHNGDTTAQLYIGYSNGTHRMFFRGWSDNATVPNWITLLDSSNYTDYTYSKSTVDTKLGAYLPLSGGRVSGRLKIGNFIQFDMFEEGKEYLLGSTSVGQLQYYDGSKWNTILHSGNIGSQSVSYATSAGNADNATKWGGFKYYNVVIDSINNAPYFKLITIRIINTYVNSAISFDVSGRNKGVAHIEVYPSGKASIGEAGVLRVEVTGNSLFADKIRAYTIGNETDSSGNIIAKVIEVWYTTSQAYDSVVVQNVHWGQNESVEINCSKYAALPTSYESYVDATMGSIYGSITKLTTPRTLWGKSFDGSANISGNMTGVGTITSSYRDGETNPAYSLTYDANALYLQSGNGVMHLSGHNVGQLSNLRVHASKSVFTGNVLINTDTDNGYKLDVNGNSYVNGTLNASGAVTVGGALDVGGHTVLGNGANVYMTDTNNASVNILELSDANNLYFGYGSAGKSYKTHIDGYDIIFNTNSSHDERMRITRDGKVLIGTTDTDSYNELRVNGGIGYHTGKNGYTLNTYGSIKYIMTSEYTDGWARGISANIDDTTVGGIGLYGGEGEFKYAYINAGIYNSSNGLRVYKGGNVTIGGGESSYKLTVWGTLYASGDTKLLRALTVDGATTLNSTLNVNGNATFDANVLCKGTLSVGTADAANIKLQRTGYNYIWADAAGGTLVFGVKDVGISSPQNASLWIRYNAVTPGTRNNAVLLGSANYRWSNVYSVNGDYSGNLTVTGSTTLNNKLTISKNGMSVTGAAYFGGGTTYYFGSTGNVSANTLTAAGATTLKSTLSVAGASTFTGNATFRNRIYLSDDVYIYWDSSYNAIRTNASFASDKTVSSLGVGSDEGGGGSADWGAVPTNIIPAVNGGYNLGSASSHWSKLYVARIENSDDDLYLNSGGYIRMLTDVVFGNKDNYYIAPTGTAYLGNIYSNGNIVATIGDIDGRFNSLGTAASKNWSGAAATDTTNLVTIGWVEGKNYLTGITKAMVTTALGYTPPEKDTTYGVATTTGSGLMSYQDKSKLDAIADSADSVSFTRSLTSGTKIGTITINGTATDLYCQTNTNTTYSAATTSTLGLLKVSNKLTTTQTLTSGNGTTANRFYGVQMDSNGVAFVNVPWTNTTYTLASITGTLSVEKGGTGATTAAAARTNLGLGTAASKDWTGTHAGDTGSLVTTTWVEAKLVGYATTAVATTSASGLMSAAMVTKLNGIASGATAVTSSTVSGWGYTKNTGTVTSVAVKMNGSTKGTVTSNGTIDLGTVLTAHQSLSGYATQSWVNTQLGSYCTIDDIDTMLSGYALKTWIDAGYVSKSSASTITAKLTVNEFSSNGSISTGGNLSVYGNITIAMGGLTAANGTVSAKTVTQTSDERLKNLIGDVRLSLGAMACAPLKKFHYHDDGVLRVGTIAQYWQGTLPEVVSTTPNGTLALGYGELGVAMGISLANHLTDLKSDLSVTDNEVEKLKKRVEELENENKRLQERVDALAA